MSLGLGLQYSDSQTIQDSNVASITKIGLGDQPTIKEDEEQTDKDEIENETKNETITQEDNQTAPKRLVPKFGAGQIAPNLTGPTVTAAPTFYKIKLIFNYIDVCEDHDPYLPSGDGEWDLIAYVQGKKIDLTAASGTKEHPDTLWDTSSGERCNTRVFFKPGTEVTVNIPFDPEGIRDAQPLSIFTVGSEVDGCLKSNLPAQLDEVIKILSDKGITRPYYADAKTKIAKIQSDINAGLNDACLGNVHNKNDILGVISGFYLPPGYEYGRYVGSSIPKPDIAGPIYHASSTNDFHLWYSISCPECASVRVHPPGQQQVPPP